MRAITGDVLPKIRYISNALARRNKEVSEGSVATLVGIEYLGSDVDSAASGDPFFQGYHLSGSWAVTDEMRGYRKRNGIFDPLPVARPVNQGGWGTLETAFRYSLLDLTDGTVEGGEMDIYSLGLNWWLTRWAQFGVDYRYISLDRFGTEGGSSGLNGRLVLMLD